MQPNEFVAAYEGKIVPNDVIYRLRKTHGADRVKYTMHFDNDNMVDPHGENVVIKYLNHSWEPNAMSMQWDQHGQNVIMIRTVKKIKNNEEVTIEYCEAYHPDPEVEPFLDWMYRTHDRRTKEAGLDQKSDSPEIRQMSGDRVINNCFRILKRSDNATFVDIKGAHTRFAQHVAVRSEFRVIAFVETESRRGKTVVMHNGLTTMAPNEEIGQRLSKIEFINDGATAHEKILQTATILYQLDSQLEDIELNKLAKVIRHKHNGYFISTRPRSYWEKTELRNIMAMTHLNHGITSSAGKHTAYYYQFVS